MQCLKAGLRVLALAVVCFVGVGCGIRPDVGLAQRCAEIMRQAYPSATFETTKQEAATTSLTTIVATVEAVRTDLAADQPVARNLAVECRFDENILTGFRWTSGPQH